MQNERISAYRIGGDEFCVILEKTNAVEIHQILDSLERKKMFTMKKTILRFHMPKDMK